MTDITISQLSPDERAATRRWKLGHHMLHLHLVAMNTRLKDARHGLSVANWDLTADAFADLVVLYNAATSTMKYAAAFSPRIYETLIRPSMAQPYLSPGFSGRLNSEHIQMLEQLAEVRRTMRGLLRDKGVVPSVVARNWTALIAAQRANSKHHMVICERFVEAGGSLLKESRSQ
jgi:hypothetical protein